MLVEKLREVLAENIVDLKIEREEITLEIAKEQLKKVCLHLRDTPYLKFEQLMDLCGVDYLHYGCSEWETEDTTSSGFSRGVESLNGQGKTACLQKSRFAVIYHLLSVTHNHRVCLKVFVSEKEPVVDSVVEIWASANWYEREAFDLYGILFAGHPDLRRILTDYGFIGHPFRKDFPLSGEVEVRYDAKQQRVIYEPVQIEPRVLVPKVIREDKPHG